VEVTTYDGGGGEDIRLCNFTDGIFCLGSRAGVSMLGANCIEDRRPSLEAPGTPTPAKASVGLETLSVTSPSSGTVCDDIDGAFKSGIEDLGEGPVVGEGDRDMACRVSGRHDRWQPRIASNAVGVIKAPNDGRESRF
jgi:hypothetical protein